MTGPIRVALVSYRSQPFSGGQGVYVSALARALVQQGVAVDVISGPPYPNLDEGIQLIRLPSLDLYQHGLRSLRWHHLASLSHIIEWFSKLTGGFAEPYTFGRRLKRYIKRHKPHYDLIHDNQSLCYALLDLRAMGYPVVATIHHPITSDLRLALSAEPSWWRRVLLRRWHSFLGMQIAVARQLPKIMTVSESARKDIEREFGVRSERLVVTGIGTDTGVFQPLATIQKDPNRIMLTASSDTALKGVVFGIEAFAILRQSYPELRLRLVGSLRADGDAQCAIDRHGLAPWIDFEKHLSQDRLVHYYNEATVFLSSSLYEGFGLPVAEAMASGTAVVATDGGALPEVVGDAGLIVPTAHPQALADAVAVLLHDSELRHGFEQKGRARIERLFSWSACAQRTIAEYEASLSHANR